MSSSLQIRLDRHVAKLLRCRKCPRMNPPVVSGGAVVSHVILVGQAPGDKEPVLGRPFAWTAGRKMFRWFQEYAGVDEATFRAKVYMAAVCRCFPGKKATGGDRVPAPDEIANCSGWLTAEMGLLQPGARHRGRQACHPAIHAVRKVGRSHRPIFCGRLRRASLRSRAAATPLWRIALAASIARPRASTARAGPHRRAPGVAAELQRRLAAPGRIR